VPQATFDEKFGPDLLVDLSTGPGVYLFKNAAGVVIYVGKAKNLRRRLQSYRNSSRKKAHRKMVRLVKAAHSVSFELVTSEQDALLRENALIQELKPKFNVDGAFSFLYPALGVTTTERHTLLCMTTAPEQFRALELGWFGTFRSRPRVKLAFEALVELLSMIGHREKKNALPEHPRLPGAPGSFRELALVLCGGR
jgi:excinuclease ABC subunit C